MTHTYTTTTKQRLAEAREPYLVRINSDAFVTSGSANPVVPMTRMISNRVYSENSYNMWIPSELSNPTQAFCLGSKKDILDQDVRLASAQIVDLLDETISPFANIDLPKVYAFIRDDGSFLIEWNFNHYKMGVSIELDISESSWHFVSDENFGYYTASGDTQNKNFGSILEWLIPFVITKRED